MLKEKNKKRRLTLFLKNKKVSAWSYTNLKGVSSKICEHKIILENNAIPIQQCQHWFNPKYSLLVKEKLNKLLKVGFIYLVFIVNGFPQLSWYLRRMAKFEYAKIFES
jgi:hypothetical protein